MLDNFHTKGPNFLRNQTKFFLLFLKVYLVIISDFHLSAIFSALNWDVLGVNP